MMPTPPRGSRRSSELRATFPIELVRSLYFLGQISERKGDRDKARDYYRRFVQYWGEGEMDREKVAEAPEEDELSNWIIE